MHKTTRLLVKGICIGTLAASGWVHAQIQSGGARKVTEPATTAEGVALGVPIALPRGAATSTGLASRAAPVAGSPVTFASGKPAINYRPEDLHGANDPIQREASPSANAARSAAAPGREFAPAPGTLRANLPPVSAQEWKRITGSRTWPANLNQGVSASGTSSTGSKTLSTSSGDVSAMRISGDANALGPASIAELARSLRNNPDLIYQYVRNNVEYYPICSSCGDILRFFGVSE